MSFASARFAEKNKARMEAVLAASVAEMRDSIKDGSSVTGAPEMPVAPSHFARAGALRDSVTVSYADPNSALIYTTSPYALDVEDNAKGHQFTSGGPHGWKLTVAASSHIIEAATTRIAGYER
jgi:hypothetical protein